MSRQLGKVPRLPSRSLSKHARHWLKTSSVLMLVCLFGGTLFAAQSAAASKHVTTKAVAKSPIVIGLNAVESGPLAPSESGAVATFTAWIDHFNQTGGVDGHHIHLITLDSAGNPATQLLNMETEWAQDHAVAMWTAGTNGPEPYSYIRSNSIPYFEFGGEGPYDFATAYPTIYNYGSAGPSAYDAFVYYLENIQHKHPTIVAIDYNPNFASWNSYIQAYWTKAGAKQVYFWADSLSSSTDCTAEVLQMKAEGVQYLQMTATEGATSCILAEYRLGWYPPDGEGGSADSQLGEALLLGRATVGVTAGNICTLYNGEPIYKTPSSIDKTFVGVMKTFAPQFANYAFMNSTTVCTAYAGAQLLTYVLQSVMNKYGKITPALINKFTPTIRNKAFGLMDTDLSFSTSCKTGTDGTVQGEWTWNNGPITPNKPQVYVNFNSGSKWISKYSYGISHCYLTTFANAALAAAGGPAN